MPVPTWLDDLKKRYPTNQDKVQAAYDSAVRQAQGVGVDPSQIDSSYVENMMLGQGGKYTSGIMALAQAMPKLSSTTNYTPQTTAASYPTVSFAEALEQARAMYNPLYDQESRSRLQSIVNDQSRRGIRGQPFAPGLTAEALAPLEAARNSQIAQTANAIVEAARNAAFQREGMDLSRAQFDWTRQRGAAADALSQSQFDWMRNRDLQSDAFAREQFDWTKQRDLASDQFSREKWDWQKSYDERQLNAASQPKAVTRTPKEQYEDSIFQKLMTPGMTLTPEEQAYIGKGTGNPWLEAIKMAQGDDRFRYAADPAVRKGVIDEYYALITGGYGGGMTGGPLADNSEDPDRKAGYLK